MEFIQFESKPKKAKLTNRDEEKVAQERHNHGFGGIKDQDEYKKYYEEKVIQLKKSHRKTSERVSM